MKQRYGSDRPWESQVGYSRVVRVDRHIYVAGTTATDASGAIVGVNDPYQQTQQTLKNIQTALAQVGAKMEHIVRTRMYIVNIEDWPAIGEAHRQYFQDIRPVATMVEVQRLVDPRMLIEIEVDALLPTSAD